METLRDYYMKLRHKMIGDEIYNFAKQLWPLNRSITGKGTRDTLKQIKRHLPNLKIKSVPTGTAVFDWNIPKEWIVNEKEEQN